MAYLIIKNQTVSSYCKKNGISYNFVRNRLKQGKTLEQSVEDYNNRRKPLRHFYKGKPVVDVLNHDKRAYSRFLFRMKEGWKLEDAVEFDLDKYGTK